MFQTLHLPPRPLTFLASLLPGSVYVVLELDADLPLSGLVADEREFEQLLGGWAAQVSLDETRVNEVNELLRPGDDGGSCRKGGGSRKKGGLIHPKVTHFLPISPGIRQVIPPLPGPWLASSPPSSDPAVPPFAPPSLSFVLLGTKKILQVQLRRVRLDQ